MKISCTSLCQLRMRGLAGLSDAIAQEAISATQVPSSRCPAEKLLIVIQKKISEIVSSG
ncbi:hypothetical protein D3C78_1421600 [compost metagenome]